MPVLNTTLKTGARPVQPNVRTLKDGDILFKEGEHGRELFILQEGEVKISRGTKEGEIELARLKKGAVLGEMSLLDNLPRSATATATTLTKATLINELVFNSVLQQVPPWLVSIVRIITSRIRDVNKRVGQSILRNREAGVASLVCLLLDGNSKVIFNQVSLEQEFVVAESFYTCRLGKAATVAVLQGLMKRQLLELGKDTAGKEFVFFKDPMVLTLFVEYLRLKERGRNFLELGIPGPEVELLDNINYVAQKSAKETKDGTELSMKAFLEDMKEKNVQNIEKMLSDLQRREVLSILPAASGNESVILFNRETLARVRKIRENIQNFQMDLTADGTAAAPKKK